MTRITRLVMSKVTAKVPERAINHFLESVEDKQKILLYGQISFYQATIMFLYHMVTAKGYMTIEKEVMFPHSNMNQVFGMIRQLMVDWALDVIRPGTLIERQLIAKSYVKKEEFTHTTLICDSADFRLEKRDRLRTQSDWHSYKEKSHAARYQFVISHDKVFRHVDGYFYPKEYDADCLGGMKDDMKLLFKKGDVMMADNHYSTLRSWKKPRVITRVRKPPKRELSDEDKVYNENFSAERSKIEHAIGDIKARFKMLRIPFRKTAEVQKDMVFIACAIHNFVYGGV